MTDEGADKQAGMPERPRRAGDGIADGKGTARQADTARIGPAGDEASLLMEQVVRRENLLAAHRRVVRNGGAPGVDGLTVEQLMDYCRTHWARIRQELLDGSYVPQPIRKVEIPKPDGKGSLSTSLSIIMCR